MGVKRKSKSSRSKTSSPFAANLKDMLAERGLTQKALAVMADVGSQSINDWLAGSQPLDLLAVQRLARALGCDFEWLLTGEQSKHLPGQGVSLTEIFEMQDEPDFTGIFQISATRLKKRGE